MLTNQLHSSYLSTTHPLFLRPHIALTMVGQGKVPRFNWNEQARLDLLLSIYRYANPTPAQWNRIIEDTSKKGYHFNANAAQ